MSVRSKLAWNKPVKKRDLPRNNSGDKVSILGSYRVSLKTVTDQTGTSYILLNF